VKKIVEAIKKRKFLVLVVLIVAISAFMMTGGIGSTAFFGDFQNTSVTITAGSLNLAINGLNADASQVLPNQMIPSATGVQGTSFTLTNQGTIPGFLNFGNITVVNQENGVTSAESKAGDDLASGVGELSNYLNVGAFIDTNSNNMFDAGTDAMVYSGLLSGIGSTYNVNVPIPAGASYKLIIAFMWSPTETDNLAQTDSASLSIQVRLSQVTMP
jgi:hypothetical protein